MKVNIEQTKLAAMLELAASATARRSTQPILSKVLVVGKAGCLSCSGTDLLVGLTAEAQVEADGVGEVCLDARGFLNVIKSLPPGPTELIMLDNYWLEIRNSRSVFKLVGTGRADYPPLTVVPQDSEQFSTVKAVDLSEVIKRVEHAVSTDQARVNLTGALLAGDGKNVTAVATDGHRMTKYERAMEGIQLTKSIVVPRSGLQQLRRMLEPLNEVQVATTKRHLFVRGADVRVSVKLSDEQFPPYEQVIPKDNTGSATVARVELLRALQASEVMAQGKRASVRVEVANGEIIINGDDPDRGTVRLVVAATTSGSSLVAAFSPRYLMDALAAVPDEDIQLDFNGELDPCLVRSKTGGEQVSVVMPMRI